MFVLLGSLSVFVFVLRYVLLCRNSVVFGSAQNLSVYTSCVSYVVSLSCFKLRFIVAWIYFH